MSNLESYPPVFRQKYLCSTSFEKRNTTEDSNPIPVVDLQCLDKLGEACKEWGVFRLVNHGIPTTLLNSLEDNAKKMLSLSFETKQTLLTSTMSYFWGTAAIDSSGNAFRSSTSQIQWMEGLHFPLSQLPQFRSKNPMLDRFRVLLEEYGKHLRRISRTLFEAMSKDLNLAPKQCQYKLAKSTDFIRAYRYPPGLVDEVWGIPPHTDNTILSILHQDQVGGLEIFKENKWLQVNPIPNTLVVNVGDMMQALSDDEYISIKHTVRVNKVVDRYSIGYFVFPEEDNVIRSSKYKPFTFAEFQKQVREDIKNLGYKVGLERFKL